MASDYSAQDMARPGECVDLYYYDGDTSKKQCFPTTQNTKYSVEFSNKSGGTSVFTIPPNNGIQDVVCELVLPAFTGAQADLEDLGIPRAWGYALVESVSFRYAGTSQYFLTGDQVFQLALRAQPSLSAADAVATLGGNAASGLDLSGVKQRANIVLTLPHNWPSGVGKSHPFPTDLLTQQVQVTLQLKNPKAIFSITAGAGAGAITALNTALANGLDSAKFVVQQVMLNNQGDALARRTDMATNVYAFPAEFIQNAVRIPLPSQGISAQVSLTGFRAGEVKALLCWVTRATDVSGSVGVAGYTNNPFLWYLPDSVTMTYAGDIYAQYENASSPLWNLINNNKQPAINNVEVDVTGAAIAFNDVLSQYFILPFAQTHVDEDSHYTLVHGRPVTNGIVNLNITMPEAAADWVLNVSYLYNTTILMSQGTADFVF